MNLLALSRTRNEHLTLSHHQVSLLILLQLLAFCPQPNCYVSATEATPSDHLPSLDQRVREALLSNDGHPARTADDQVVIAAWKELMAKGKQWSDHMANDRWLPYLEQKFTATGVNISVPCQNDIRRTLTSFGRLETWAAQSKLTVPNLHPLILPSTSTRCPQHVPHLCHSTLSTFHNHHVHPQVLHES